MDSKVKQNVRLLLRLPRNQNISINWIRQKLESSFLKMDKKGNPVYLNFFSYLVQFGGYSFRTLVESIDIEYQIQETVGPSHQSLESYLVELLEGPYESNTPFWKISYISFT